MRALKIIIKFKKKIRETKKIKKKNNVKKKNKKKKRKTTSGAFIFYNICSITYKARLVMDCSPLAPRYLKTAILRLLPLTLPILPRQHFCILVARVCGITFLA